MTETIFFPHMDKSYECIVHKHIKTRMELRALRIPAEEKGARVFIFGEPGDITLFVCVAEYGKYGRKIQLMKED